MRHALPSGIAFDRSRSDEGVRICDTRNSEWQCAADDQRQQSGEADCDEHAAAEWKPGQVQEAGGYRYWEGAWGSDTAEPLRRECVEAVPRGSVLGRIA